MSVTVVISRVTFRRRSSARFRLSLGISHVLATVKRPIGVVDDPTRNMAVYPLGTRLLVLVGVLGRRSRIGRWSRRPPFHWHHPANRPRARMSSNPVIDVTATLLSFFLGGWWLLTGHGVDVRLSWWTTAWDSFWRTGAILRRSLLIRWLRFLLY